MTDPKEMRKEDGEGGKSRVSPYRLHLTPNNPQRRPEWHLEFVSDTALTLDFFHTNLMEKVVIIHVKPLKDDGEKDVTND